MKPVIRILEKNQINWLWGKQFNVLSIVEAWELAAELKAACVKKKESEGLTSEKTYIIISL
jgi:hypothetical protein